MSSYYEYETVQHNVSGSRKQLPLIPSSSSISDSPQQQQHHHARQQHWKSAALNGFTPATLNSSGRSRGPFVTHVTIRDPTSGNSAITGNGMIPQSTYQQVQKNHHHQRQMSANGGQPHASKV